MLSSRAESRVEGWHILSGALRNKADEEVVVGIVVVTWGMKKHSYPFCLSEPVDLFLSNLLP